MKSKIAGCTHHSSKVVSKFRNGGEVGGIGGGSGVDGSGNRGNGGYGGGTSGNQGGGGMGGGGKGGVGGTGVNSSVKTGTKMRNSPPAMKMGQKVVPTSAPPPAAVSLPKYPPSPNRKMSPNPTQRPYDPATSFMTTSAQSPNKKMSPNPTQRPYDAKLSPSMVRSGYRKGGMVKKGKS